MSLMNFPDVNNEYSNKEDYFSKYKEMEKNCLVY